MELSERVNKHEDGKYRWLYELDMYKNMGIFKTVMKVVGICLAGITIMLLWLEMRERNSFATIMKDLSPVFISAAVVLLISVGAYLYVARMYNGKYCIVYEMDEEGITFIQLKEQFEKQQAIAKWAAFTGALTGNIGLIGSAFYNMTNSEVTSLFKKVYRVKAVPEDELIKVDSPFLFNQVYVNKDDFEMVYEFIRDHCVKIAKRDQT